MSTLTELRTNGSLSTIGNVVNIAGYDWTVFHVADGKATLGMNLAYRAVGFRTYDDKDAVKKATTKAQEELFAADPDLEANLVDTVVDGVTRKVFSATYEMLDSVFEWCAGIQYTPAERNAHRVLYAKEEKNLGMGEEGTEGETQSEPELRPVSYWLDSYVSDLQMDDCHLDGRLFHDFYRTPWVFWLRPFMTVQL